MNRVKLVGILNITPDSFSGDGLTNSNVVLEAARQMFEDGASYLDVGAESTRPGAKQLTAEEEWTRLSPVLNSLIFTNQGRISVDSYHPETVAEVACRIGSFIINDVTGFSNERMVELASTLGMPCIVSHLPEAVDQDVQAAHNTKEKIDSAQQVEDELMARRSQLISAGVRADMIILDPGIGFGKTKEANWTLLAFADRLPSIIKVMIGYSKKRFLGEDRMTISANLVAGQIAVDSGATYLRLHADLIASHNKQFNY
jgi:dihydropteroate synthase